MQHALPAQQSVAWFVKGSTLWHASKYLHPLLSMYASLHTVQDTVGWYKSIDARSTHQKATEGVVKEQQTECADWKKEMWYTLLLFWGVDMHWSWKIGQWCIPMCWLASSYSDAGRDVVTLQACTDNNGCKCCDVRQCVLPFTLPSTQKAKQKQCPVHNSQNSVFIGTISSVKPSPLHCIRAAAEMDISKWKKKLHDCCYCCKCANFWRYFNK